MLTRTGRGRERDRSLLLELSLLGRGGGLEGGHMLHQGRALAVHDSGLQLALVLVGFVDMGDLGCA